MKVKGTLIAPIVEDHLINCPLCATSLNDIEYEGVRVHTCDGCGGEVIGPNELGHVVRVREMRFDESLLEELEARAPKFGIDGEPRSHRSLACPQCGEPMQTVNYSGDSAILIDRCGACATMFLDHAELEKIQALMEQWSDEAPGRIRAISNELERTRRETAESTSRAFAGSRFAFFNAIVNRLLDAA